MNTVELLNIRLHNQLLLMRKVKEPHEIVSWMGAMQSQALDMAKWAIGVRFADSRFNDIDEALNTGKIIRTHILRPTWHFVAAEDIYWMFDLSNSKLKKIYHAYGRQSGSEQERLFAAISLIENALQGNRHMTKQELCDYLKTQGITFDARHMTLAIHYAEMEGVLCNGQLRDNKQTFTLLEEWVPCKQAISKEEALTRLARKYFTSHAPATLNDFAWWSGLTLTECKQALELIKKDFFRETINGRECWMKDDISIPQECKDKDSALLLPPFDEFVVSYKNRSELIEDVHYSKVMTQNGLFSPTVMLNGEIVGSWKKITQREEVKIELSFFEKISPKAEKLFDAEIKRVEHFYTSG